MEPGGILTAVITLLVVIVVLGIAGLAWTWRDVRRRRDAQVRAPATGAVAARELGRLPADVRDDWRRLQRARELLAGLVADGWVDPAAIAEVDELTVRLHGILVAERDSEALGGRGAPDVERQVEDLADLLVALADEALAHQADETRGHAAAATLEEARTRMTALRSARREVEQLDGGPVAAPEPERADADPQGAGDPERAGVDPEPHRRVERSGDPTRRRRDRGGGSAG